MAASYAPFYRLPTSQHSYLARQQKRRRKRKRGAVTDDDDDDDDDDDNDKEGEAEYDEQKVEDEAASSIKLGDEPRVLHPVNKRDPYYIAGWAREKPLPGGSFPHAAIRESDYATPQIEEELANLNPPIYAPKKRPDNPAGSLRGRHLDNMTAILHKCMLNQDWTRASRVWGLILRTEVAGFGPDIRQHGRWMIGAELLMRRHQTLDEAVDDGSDEASSGVPVISDEGFQLARQYYERMCLQYPHLARSHHSAVNAYAIYPAFFNIWIYEVQGRSKRARQKLTLVHESTDFDDTQSVRSDSSEHMRALRQIRKQELSDAAPLTHRLDELLLGPPYDTSSELLELRGMISLWSANLHKVLGEVKDTSDEDGEDNDAVDASFSRVRHRKTADAERAKAKEIFLRMTNKGMELSAENLAFLESDDSLLADAEAD